MLFHDLRYAVRALRRMPLFTAVAILSLAVGLGATVTAFALVNQFFLRPVPALRAAGELHTLHRTAPRGEDARRFSHPEYNALAEAAAGSARLAGFTDRGFNLDAGGETRLTIGLLVSGSYFRVLGVGAERGRVLEPADDRVPGEHPVVVLGHRLWQRRLGGDPGIVGSTVRINGSPYTVVGIAAEGFQGTFHGFATELFIPLSMAEMAAPGSDLDNPQADLLEVIARRGKGVSAAAAEAALSGAFARIEAALHPGLEPRRLAVRPLTGFDEEIRGGAMALVATLLALALLVLAVAGTNVAGMLLVRAVERRRELAVRAALGGGGRRLTAQLLTESVLLALVGGLGGLMLAAWAVEALRAFDPFAATAAPLVLDLAFDGRVVGFALALTLAAGLTVGLAPALRAARADLAPALAGGSAGRPRSSRLRALFVVSQVALTLVLLAAAGLFVRTLARAAATDPGFEPTGVVAATVDTSLLDLPEPADRARYYRRLLAAVSAEPTVAEASLTRKPPLTFGRLRTPVALPGSAPAAMDEPSAQGDEPLRADLTAVAPGYFAALRIPLRSGRDFSAADRLGAPAVAIVNRTLAERLWPGEDPIGRRISNDGEELEVVGLAADSAIHSLHAPAPPALYRPFDQVPGRRATLLVRSRAGAEAPAPEAVAPILTAVLRTFDPDLPILRVGPLPRLQRLSLLPQRIAGSAAGVLGAVALLLAAFGLYGVVAYTVSRRGRELAVRVSLGADRGDVLRLVLARGLRLLAAGLVVGLVLSLALGRLLASLLAGVSPADPLALAGVVLLLSAVAIAAAWVPARRAARTDPVAALRAD